MNLIGQDAPKRVIDRKLCHGQSVVMARLVAARKTRYAIFDRVRGPRSRDDIVLAWMIQYEWLLFFGLILALALADLVATRRAARRSNEQEASKHNSANARD